LWLNSYGFQLEEELVRILKLEKKYTVQWCRDVNQCMDNPAGEDYTIHETGIFIDQG